MEPTEKKTKIRYRIALFFGLGLVAIGVLLAVRSVLPTGGAPQEVISEVPLATSSDTRPENPIDFTSLQKINPDIYAWIRIPNTRIDYPVVQSPTDDSYYLKHNAEKKYSSGGAIYSEMKNKRDFSDPNTVLYGHNMINGSMFRDLHQFRKADFFKANETVYIYTPGHILTYQICAAYRYDNRHILNSFHCNDPAVFAEYLAFVQNPKSMIKQTRLVPMSQNTKLLTLSTCISNRNYRYLVQGVLVKDEATK